MKGKSLRRALAVDPIRIGGPEKVPLIHDTTEFVTPEMAQEMLTRNRSNRPVNWNKVEEYSEIMKRDGWKLHAQGIILDGHGNIITGQTRLWAVIYSARGVYFRISRGSPSETASLIDRGRPQSSRDLATRKTERKHSPVEASIARAICVLRGNTRPSVDDLAAILVEKEHNIRLSLSESRQTKKTKSVLMILAAICESLGGDVELKINMRRVTSYAESLESALRPHVPGACWGKGVAFSMAMEQARKIINPQ